MITQAEVAQHAGVDLSTVNRILNRRTVHTFRQETVRRVLNSAKQLGFTFSRLRHFHRRRAERMPVTVACRLVVFRNDRSMFDEGKCVLRDLSPFGALIGDVVLGREAIPAGIASVLLGPLEGPLKGIEVRGRIVRVNLTDKAGYGVEFFRVQKMVLGKLATLCRRTGQLPPPDGTCRTARSAKGGRPRPEEQDRGPCGGSNS